MVPGRALATVLPAYPDLKVEIVTDYRLSDIVAERFDIGVRYGDQVAKDMVAVRITADSRMAIVCSPPYQARSAGAGAPAGPALAQLHHAAPAHPRVALCLGTAEGLA